MERHQELLKIQQEGEEKQEIVRRWVGRLPAYHVKTRDVGGEHGRGSRLTMNHKDARILISAIEISGKPLNQHETKNISDVKQRIASGGPILKSESDWLQEIYRKVAPTK